MKKIKIETLTPVHIGSGRELMRDVEFLTMRSKGEDVFVVIDEEKVFDIVGEENVSAWVNLIETKQNLKKYLIQRKPDLKASDISKRQIYVEIDEKDDFSKNKSLKEQLHDGRGIRYIPGSSLKGAIRTAILSQKVLQNPDLASKNLKDFKEQFSGKVLESKLFGNNPNEDVFRFLQVSDVYFDYQTIALKAEIFNRMVSGWSFKEGGSQLIEAIPDGAESTFTLNINRTLLKHNNSRYDTDFLNEKKMFQLINEHTRLLLEKEIEFWHDENLKEPVTGDKYIEKLNELLETVNECTEKEAVLRIGFGSGWDFITGGWIKNEEVMTDNDYDKFLYLVRKQAKYDENVPFPKSRKLGNSADIFGFVKLIMED